jgi:hypothetical protein
MKSYRIMLDISSIYSKIKHLHLKSYNSPFPTIFISANDPDDACKTVFDQLITSIVFQDPSIKMRILCRKIKRQCRIDKIYLL